MRKSLRLPKRFPVGTKYVLESRGAFVHRYVEFPDGRKARLGLRKAQTCICAALSSVSIVPEINASQRSSRRKWLATTH
jgi:hypothetical protein